MITWNFVFWWEHSNWLVRSHENCDFARVKFFPDLQSVVTPMLMHLSYHSLVLSHQSKVALIKADFLELTSKSSVTMGMIDPVSMVSAVASVGYWTGSLWVKDALIMMIALDLITNTLRPRQNGRHFADAIFKFEYRLKFRWSLFLRVQLTISQHWFR